MTLFDNRPLWMIEVKASDDDFSPFLFRFRGKLPSTTPLQIVYDLKRKKTKDSVRMLPAHEFLRDLRLLQGLRKISLSASIMKPGPPPAPTL